MLQHHMMRCERNVSSLKQIHSVLAVRKQQPLIFKLLDSFSATKSTTTAIRNYTRSTMVLSNSNSDNDGKVSNAFIAFVQDFKVKMALVQSGIKLFYNEFNEVSALRSTKGREMSSKDGSKRYNKLWVRKEILMAKRVSEATIRVALAAAIFCFPGGGLLVAGVLLWYPQHLPSYFWNDSMKDIFVYNDYLHRVHLQRVALLEQEKSKITVMSTSEHRSSHRQALMHLAAYHGVIDTRLLNKAHFVLNSIFGAHLIQISLQSKFADIFTDDSMLSEAAITDLTRNGLQKACVERMLCSPNSSDSHMQAHIKEWVAFNTERKLEMLLLNNKTANLPAK